jgi:hypothetical protein
VRTESGTVDAPKTPSDPDLALIQERWPDLPAHVKATVMALIRTHAEGANESGGVGSAILTLVRASAEDSEG